MSKLNPFDWTGTRGVTWDDEAGKGASGAMGVVEEIGRGTVESDAAVSTSSGCRISVLFNLLG